MQRLKEELDKQKQTLALNATYLAELESRLETSDDRVEDLTRQIADLEREAKQPGEPEAIALNHDHNVNENRRLMDTLEQKDSRLRDLQRELDKALRECTVFAAERKDAHTHSERHATARPNQADDADMSTKVPGSPGLTDQNEPAIESELANQNVGEYYTLKKEHLKTLADLTIITEQYQKALADINRLTLQFRKTSQQEPAAASGNEVEQAEAKGSDPTTDIASEKHAVDDEKREEGDQPKTEPALTQDFQAGRGQSRIPSSRYVVHVRK